MLVSMRRRPAWKLPPSIIALVFVCSSWLGCGGGGGSNGSSSPQPNPQPQITSLSPSTVPVGTNSSTLTINGSGFLTSSVVTFNGASRTPTFVSSAQLSLSLSSSDLANIRNFAVVVTNPPPGGGQSAPVNLKVEGGTLQIQINGLPSGTVGNVSVTSTSGFSVMISTNQILQLPPATYSVIASATLAGNVNYYATPAQQSVDVIDGSSNSIQVTYNTAVPTTTKALDQTGSESLVASADSSTLTMSSSSSVAQSLAPGDILAIGVTPSTPEGLLRKVVSVSQSGSMITVTTTQGTLAEAFQEANFSFQGTLGPQSFQKAIALRSGVRVLRPDANQKVAAKALSSSTSLADPCAANLATFVELIDVPIVQDASGSITATGQIEVCPSLQFNWSIRPFPPRLDSLLATATVGSDVHVNVTGNYDQSFNTNVPILTLRSAEPITVFVGEVPIVMFPKLTFFVGASGDVTVGFSTGVTQTATATAGISYNSGQVSPVLTATNQFGTDPFGIDGGLSVKAFAGVSIEVDIDGVLSPEFSPDAYLALDVSPLQNPWWTLTGGLEGEGSVSVSIFGFADLADFKFPNLFEYPVPPYTIAQASGGFLTSAAAPTLSAVQPNGAPVGSPDLTLALTGTNFVPGARVSFNGLALPTTFTDPEDLTATLGSGQLATAGTSPVTVTNPDTPGATSNSLNFTVSASVGNPAPSITSLSPDSAAVGTSSQTVAINGQNFLSSSTVTYNGVAHAATFVTSGQLTINLTTSDMATAGGFPIVVTNPAPGGGASNALNFTVAAANPIPVITSLSPSSASAGSAAQTLTINGGNFVSSSSVSFNGTARVTIFVSSSQLTITLTAADLATAGTFPVSVTNPAPGGGTSNIVSFIVSSGTSGSVILSPTSVTVPEGGAQTFTASVAGSSNGVTWSVQEGSAGGTIASSTPTSAVYVPPSNTGAIHIVATSIDDPSQVAVGTVIVMPPFTLTVLHSFSGSPDGESPHANLIQASDGNFYGTTEWGGASTSFGCGTVFRMDASGNVSILHSFSGAPDGCDPRGGLIQARDGNLYGTTASGGMSTICDGTIGCGTVFRMDASGNMTILHLFPSLPSEGEIPFDGLIQASDGNFYGTTIGGGAYTNLGCLSGCGTVFRMDASGNVSVLHSFSGPPDGESPYGVLIQASDGNFYGTTIGGGAPGPDCLNGDGCGAVFKIDASGNVTILHSFSDVPDADYPHAGLIQASDGNFYGASGGGSSASCTVGGYVVVGCGTVFRMDASGNVSVLHSFSGAPDGQDPSAGLIQARDGNFYGTTSSGGASGNGTVFKIDASGNVTIVHSFSSSDGAYPAGRLIQGADGNLYGTAESGGTAYKGVVFRLELTPPSGP
jgi:uncharacterized repeat protein (TIGR03803 family)